MWLLIWTSSLFKFKFCSWLRGVLNFAKSAIYAPMDIFVWYWNNYCRTLYIPDQDKVILINPYFFVLMRELKWISWVMCEVVNNICVYGLTILINNGFPEILLWHPVTTIPGIRRFVDIETYHPDLPKYLESWSIPLINTYHLGVNISGYLESSNRK